MNNFLQFLEKYVIPIFCIFIWIICVLINKYIIKKGKDNSSCTMLLGTVGSGKTYYYEKIWRVDNVKKKEKVLYIECSYSSKKNLSDLIVIKRWCSLVAKAFLVVDKCFSSETLKWIMPKNTIIVFDDIDMLHSGNNNYLDLIGIIDFLKQNNNKILLIASENQIDSNILVSYLEKVVDKTIEVPFVNFETLLLKRGITIPNDTGPMHNIYAYFSMRLYNNTFTNKRVLLNCWQQLDDAISEYFKETNANRKMYVLSLNKENLINFIAWFYLFQVNSELVGKVFSSNLNDKQTTFSNKELEELEKYDLTCYPDKFLSLNNIQFCKINSALQFKKYNLLIYILDNYFRYSSGISISNFNKDKKLKDLLKDYNLEQKFNCLPKKLKEALQEAETISSELLQDTNLWNPNTDPLTFSRIAIYLIIGKHHNLAENSPFIKFFEKILKEKTILPSQENEISKNKDKEIEAIQISYCSIWFFDKEKTINEIIKEIRTKVDEMKNHYEQHNFT